MLNILVISFCFLCTFATTFSVAADPHCELIFSKSKDGVLASTKSEGEVLALNMLRNTPEYFNSVMPIKVESLEYLEIRFSPLAHKKAGFGFAGGTFAKSIENLDARVVRFFESYGIKVVSLDHLIVPTPQTLRILHQRKLSNQEVSSAFEPVLVRGRINDLQYLQLISKGKWPIDATGSIEYLHDLLNHWPAAAFTPEPVADMQIRSAQAGVLLLQDKWIQKGKSRKRAEYIAKQLVAHIDENNSITHLALGIDHMIPRTTQSMTITLRFLGKLSEVDNHNLSGEKAISIASKALVSLRAHQIAKKVNLAQHFTLMGAVKVENLANMFREAYQSRLASFD